MRDRRRRAVAVLLAAALVASVVSPAAGQAGRRGQVLDVNTASEKQLLAIPGLTPALVSRLTERRPFLAMTDLDSALAELDRDDRTAIYGRAFVQVDLNRGSESDLRLIPRLDDRTLDLILARRPFRTLAQFRRDLSASTSAAELVRLEAYVFVPIDLNQASDADILSIPGVGQRMLREFKEYRPYKAMQQFRREIRKYVDDREVARLERYVTLP